MTPETTNNAAPEIPQAAANLEETVQSIPEDCYCPAVVVMCHPGTLDLMKRIWEERLQNTALIFIELDESTEGLLNQLGRALAHKEITPTFVLAPANLIPCSEITLDDLQIPVVYVTKDGKRVYDAVVPMTFDVEKAQELIEEMAIADTYSAEEFVKLNEDFARAYAERHRTRALEVGISFGNYVSPVTRGTPCGNKVIEALMRKKFLSANKVGFEAIESEIIMTLKK